MSERLLFLGTLIGLSINAAPSFGQTPVRYTELRSPCDNRNPLRNVYFGDLHVHTSYSFDAYVFDTRNDAADAYRFARGETIFLPPLNSSGEGTVPLRIDRPLDFAAVTDHSEFLGEVDVCTTPSSAGFNTPACQLYRSGLAGFAAMGARLAVPNPRRPVTYCGGSPTTCTVRLRSVWEEIQRAAENAYDRSAQCRFTTFVAYEYTGSPGANYHRNVIFRNEQVPALPTSYFEAPQAQELWARLRADCVDAPGGCEALTIPHNSNLAEGILLTPEYPQGSSREEQQSIARERAFFEPMMEIYQHKGASECFPAFTSDEQCGFEILDQEPCAPGASGNCTVRNDYLRGALQLGLEEQTRIGVNPFQYGVIASTDTHNAAPGSVDEATWRGHGGLQDSAARVRLAIAETFSPGGLVAVWAVENSRDALFEAMARKETYGTSGPRMAVRFFGGWSFDEDLCRRGDFLNQAYQGGVPMGGELLQNPDTSGAPRFVVQATKDRVDLERVQIVKVWVDSAGSPQEAIYDVAGRRILAAGVNQRTCEPFGRGFDSLCGVFSDPNYDASLPAAYYARVLELPTCRWSERDCDSLAAAGRPAACDGPRTTVQERAWTSPIWVGARP